MALSSSAINVAEKLIKKYGEAGVLSRVTGSSYDPATGENTPTTESQNCKVYIAPVSAEDMQDTTVLRTDSRFIMSVVGVNPPQVNDTLTVDSVTYNVQSAMRIKVSGLSVLYKGILRV
jgi:hypothetical protein